jgi:two-component system LytT family sensor kinase
MNSDYSETDSIRSGGLLGLSGWRKWLFWFILWTLLGLTEAARLYIRYNVTKVIIPWPQAVSWGLLDFYLWGVLSPLVVWAARWLPFERGKWIKSLMGHIVLSLAISLIQLFFYTIIYYEMNIHIFHTPESGTLIFLNLYVTFIRSMINTALMIYFIIAFVSYTIINYQRYRDEELRLAELEGKLALAQLEALKMQLHPHFLFNTLNSISALVRSDPEAADRMVARLGELLRITLDSEGHQEVPLKNEVDFLNRYLDIQKMRFGDRLNIKMEIPPELLDALVPNLILQPIVENAIQHGIARLTDSGRLRISARRDKDTLCLSVEDNGPGMKAGEADKSRNGRGMSNTAARLERMYGKQQQLTFKYEEGQGMQVAIEIPFNLPILKDKEDNSN